MDINWFPGHMAKALRTIKEQLPLVDLVLEICDARIPRSSRNPELQAVLEDKPSVIVLNKADLADPRITEEWLRCAASAGLSAVPCNSKKKEGFEALIAESLRKAGEKTAAGRKNRPLRLMAVGIPNSGKSTLINSMTGRRAARTSDRPGVTRGPQRIKSRDGSIEWLDMPGVLLPKLETEEQKLSLSATGAIKDQLLPIEEVAYFLFKDLLESYPEETAARYRIQEFYEDPYENYLEAARKKGCIRSGGKVDSRRFAEMLLNDFRSGKIGRISLERCREKEGRL